MGTNRCVWLLRDIHANADLRLAVEGLSRMKRQHIHFAQGIPGSGVISGKEQRFMAYNFSLTLSLPGMRTTSQVYIHLNVPMALEAGLKLMISSNEVVCCPGDENGFLSPRFFRRVEWAGNRQAVPGWDKPREFLSPSNPINQTLSQPDSPQ
jgi:2'-phosphotransferase